MKDKIIRITKQVFKEGFNKEFSSYIIYFTTNYGVIITERNDVYNVRPYKYFGPGNVFLFDKKIKEESDYLTDCFNWINELNVDELKKILKDAK